MKDKKGLQRLTNSKVKVDRVLALEEITLSDLEQLNRTENDSLMEILGEKLNKLKGSERDKFCRKINLITSEATKNQIWENNHLQIGWAISSLIRKHGNMPSKTEIAIESELGRQTIDKHLKEYANHPQYLGQIEQFRFMIPKVLARVFQFAVDGDVGAAKLYFNVMGMLNNGKPSNRFIQNQQNNFIQINSMTINQELLKHLKPEQLDTIESILKAAIPQSDATTDGLEYGTNKLNQK